MNWKSFVGAFVTIGLLIAWLEAAKVLSFQWPVTTVGIALLFLLTCILDMTTIRLVNFEEPRAVSSTVRIVLVSWLALSCIAPVFFLPSIGWMIDAGFSGASTSIFFGAMAFTLTGPPAVIIVPLRLRFSPRFVGLCIAAWLTSFSTLVISLYAV